MKIEFGTTSQFWSMLGIGSGTSKPLNTYRIAGDNKVAAIMNSHKQMAKASDLLTLKLSKSHRNFEGNEHECNPPVMGTELKIN